MAETLWLSLTRLAPMAPRFVSVTYGAGGTTRERTRKTVNRINSETGLSAAAHLTCVGATNSASIELTESYAMLPTASVSGYYIAHPDSRYFGTGKIAQDQVADYAERKGMDLAIAERWLAPILGYERS